MMNAEHFQLYQRIQAFCIDESNAELPFSRRLAKENRWTIEYAQRVIEEYKKFAFLAVVAGHIVSPSDAVDQAWHLHLLFTRSYWEVFCPQVLQLPLHHTPAEGGGHDRDKYIHYYRQTLASYQRFFGNQPPSDIWLPTHIRFETDRHVRINLEQHWIIRRIQFNDAQWRINRGFAALLPFVFSVLLTGCTETPNPLNLSGPDFLTLYLQLAVLSVAVAVWLRSRLKRSTQAAITPIPQLNPEEMAYLAGGAEQVVNLAIVNLVQQGCVKPVPATRSFVLQTAPSRQATAIERAVAQLIQKYEKVQQVQIQAPKATDINAQIERLQVRLQNLGLLMSRAQADRVRWLSGLPIWALLLLGLAKVGVGISRGKPVVFLILLCILTGMIGLWFLKTPRRTPAGDQELRHLQSQYRGSPEVAISFALLGAEVLVGGELQNLRQSLVPPSSSGSDSGSSGCSGGSCGGGGGCGGCGG